MARKPGKAVPTLKSRRFEMRFESGMIDRIDGWRAKQPGLPPRAEAIRRLVDQGLKNDAARKR
ncbi:MAG TPA: hypothetical protein VGD13_10250 [Xanthobacteraceae bacterium]|jgi:hypothetical protein